MTEEEINKKAEKHCNEVLCNAHEKCYEVIKCRDWRSRRAGFFCGYEQALKDLEKENAELIHENARLVTVIDKSKSWGISPLNALIINNLDAQLTKAKEIISEFMEYKINEYDGSLEIHFEELKKQAEQFISEVEK